MFHVCVNACVRPAQSSVRVREETSANLRHKSNSTQPQPHIPPGARTSPIECTTPFSCPSTNSSVVFVDHIHISVAGWRDGHCTVLLKIVRQRCRWPSRVQEKLFYRLHCNAVMSVTGASACQRPFYVGVVSPPQQFIPNPRLKKKKRPAMSRSSKRLNPNSLQL